MKKNMTAALMATILLITMNSCARYYGIKKPIAIPEKREVAEQQEPSFEPTPETLLTQTTEPIETPKLALVSPENKILVAPEQNQGELVIIDKPSANATTNIKKAPIVQVISKPADNDAKMDGFAVAGFVVSIVGFFVAGLILGSLGIIFSAIALVRINKSNGSKRGRGLAITGLILGIVAVVLTAILLIAVL